jgi:hypothetical protein
MRTPRKAGFSDDRTLILSGRRRTWIFHCSAGDEASLEKEIRRLSLSPDSGMTPAEASILIDQLHRLGEDSDAAA